MSDTSTAETSAAYCATRRMARRTHASANASTRDSTWTAAQVTTRAAWRAAIVVDVT